MTETYIVGSYTTAFKRWPGKSIKDLTKMAYQGVLKDTGLDSVNVESAWFSNCGWGHTFPPVEDDPGMPGQMNVRGQMALAPLVNEGIFPKRVPVINVEGACSSGSLAFYGAWTDVLSGNSDVSLAIGVEKIFFPKHLLQIVGIFAGGADVALLPDLFEKYKRLGAECGKEWSAGTSHTLFMDVYATVACWHMKKYGTTQTQIAAVASKNHFHGSLNPLAQYQFEVPIEKVLADYPVSWPLTRSMCSPISDGAAAAIICTDKFLNKLPKVVKNRAIKIRACVPAGGFDHNVDEPSVSNWAAHKAYRMAKIKPEDVCLAEVHDATAFAEIHQLEQLGLCPMGDGGKYTESGATRYDGTRPINTSGGLESKGHPIGATGLSQINEIVVQLRGEAGKRQVKKPQIGMIENGGGVIGFEESCCVVTILSK